MKILGIVASARKGGNTEILVTEALNEAAQEGAVTEMFHVSGKKLEYCDGCNSCHQVDKCHIDDDMQQLYKMMMDADGIIFGTPVYYANVSAQAKTIIDRSFRFGKNHELKGKVAAPIVALRRVGASQTKNIIYGYFLSMGMVPVWGAIGYGRNKGEVRNGEGGATGVPALEEARKTGKSVVSMLKRISRE